MSGYWTEDVPPIIAPCSGWYITGTWSKEVTGDVGTVSFSFTTAPIPPEPAGAEKMVTIFAKPQTEFVARFLGYENVYKAQLIKSDNDSSVVAVDGVQLRISGTMDSAEKTIAVLPEDITVQVSPIKRRSANIFKGAIVEYADMGPFVMLTVDAGLILKAVVTKSVFMEKALEAGKEVWLHFKGDAVKNLE